MSYIKDISLTFIRFHYDAWRPETAIHHTDIWLPSGHNISDSNWKPLLTPTPIEQEYTSGHGCVGGAAAAALKAFNGGDEIDVTISSLVTQPPQKVLTRHFTNLSAAAHEIGISRVYGGVSIIHHNFFELGQLTSSVSNRSILLSRPRLLWRLGFGLDAKQK